MAAKRVSKAAVDRLRVTVDPVVKAWADSVGEDAVLLGAKPKRVSTVTTGNILWDHATGVGGVPEGRLVETYGPESCGKTTAALQTVVSFQQKYPDDWVFYGDMEHSLDLTYAHDLGVNLAKVALSQPESGERMFQVMKSAIKTGKFRIAVLDSVAALVPESEISGEDTDKNDARAAQATMLSKEFRRLNGIAGKYNCLVYCINQVRDKPDARFGPSEYTPGGKALKFYSSMRFSMRNIGQIKEGDSVVGNTIRITVSKNKLASPFKKVEIPLVHGKGFQLGAALFEVCAENPGLGLVKFNSKERVWKVGDATVKGKTKAKEAFAADVILQMEAEAAVKEALAAGTLKLPAKE